MGRRSALLFLVCAVVLPVFAQESRGGSTTINATLQTALDARRSQPGDAVRASVLVDMKIGDRVAIPKGAVFTGKVVSVTPKSSSAKESTVEIAFDTLTIAENQVYPIAATVQAAIVKATEEDTPTVGGGAPTRAMSGTNNGGVTSDISEGDRERGAVVAEDADVYRMGKVMPTTASGVHGVKNVSLKTNGDSTIISSSKHDVSLPAGTQLLLLVRNR
jgi:hypothetical protein